MVQVIVATVICTFYYITGKPLLLHCGYRYGRKKKDGLEFAVYCQPCGGFVFILHFPLKNMFSKIVFYLLINIFFKNIILESLESCDGGS